MNWADIKQ